MQNALEGSAMWYGPPTLAHGRPALGGWRFIERRLTVRTRWTMLGGGRWDFNRAVRLLPGAAENQMPMS